MQSISSWMVSLFVLLFLKNLLAFLTPNSVNGRLIKDILRLLVLLFVLSSLSLLPSWGRNVLERFGEESLDTEAFLPSEAEPVWLKEEYARVLREQAEPVLREEGMDIDKLTLTLGEDGTIEKAKAFLIDTDLKETLVEIRIEDITLGEAEEETSSGYRRLLAECWGLEEERVEIVIRE